MLQPVARKTLVDEVLDQLQQYIVAQGLKAGDVLAPECDLAAALGVGRSTIREALRYLQTVGLLYREPRRGSVLQPMSFKRLAEVSKFLVVREQEDLDELFIVRRLLEVGTIPIVIQNATEEDFERLEEANRLMEQEIREGIYTSESDAAFHDALLRAAGVRMLTQFCTLVQEWFRDPRARAETNKEHDLQDLEHHRLLLRYIKDGNVEAAQRTMEAHLNVYIELGTVSAVPERAARRGTRN